MELFFWTSVALANGSAEGGKELWGFSLLSGVVLGILLGGTVLAGHFMLKGKVPRKVHHLLALITLIWALIHAVYNIWLH